MIAFSLWAPETVSVVIIYCSALYNALEGGASEIIVAELDHTRRTKPSRFESLKSQIVFNLYHDQVNLRLNLLSLYKCKLSTLKDIVLWKYSVNYKM